MEKINCLTIYCIEVYWTEHWYGSNEPMQDGSTIVKCFKEKETAEKYLDQEFNTTIKELKDEIVGNDLDFDEKFLNVDNINKFVSYDDKTDVSLSYTIRLVEKPFVQ